MSLGRLKRVKNSNPRFGEHLEYVLCKLQADYSFHAEEYVLLTDSEVTSSHQRALRNPEDRARAKLGVLSLIENKDPVAGSDPKYYAVNVRDEGKVEKPLLLTPHDLERARLRAERHPDLIAANKTNWFWDLFD